MTRATAPDGSGDPVDPGVWDRWPATGDLQPYVSIDHLYTVSVTLPSLIGDLAEATASMRAQLARCHVMTAVDQDRQPVVILTIESPDLWFAILTVMNALAAGGHRPRRLTAEPAIEFEARRVTR